MAEIWDHIADNDLAAADRWLDQLDKQLRLLATQPLMGRARNKLAEGLRSLPMGRHIVFYVPLGDGIDVVRFLHMARGIDVFLVRRVGSIREVSCLERIGNLRNQAKTT